MTTLVDHPQKVRLWYEPDPDPPIRSLKRIEVKVGRQPAHSSSFVDVLRGVRLAAVRRSRSSARELGEPKGSLCAGCQPAAIRRKSAQSSASLSRSSTLLIEPLCDPMQLSEN